MSLRICDACGVRSTERFAANDKVTFKCSCGNVMEGGTEDRIMKTWEMSTTENTDKYQILIRNSSFMREGNLTKRECPKCKLPYLTQNRIGPEQTIVYTCKCGYVGTS